MIQFQDIKQSNDVIINDITNELLDSRLKKINWNKTIIKRNLRSLVKERKLLIPEEHFFWINGLLSAGILSYTKEFKQGEPIQTLLNFYQYFKIQQKSGFKCFYLPDQIIHANVLLELYKQGHIEFLELIKEAEMFIKKESQNDPNLLIHYRGKDFDFYIDSLGMIIGFCLNYGNYFHDEEMTKIGLSQMNFVLQNCMNELSHLPCHIYKNAEKKAFGPWSWGRGIGWYLIGLTEILVGLDNNHVDYEVYLKAYQDAMEVIFVTQDDLGYLYNDIVSKEHIDTSATAMIGYCLGVGIEKRFVDINKYKQCFFRCIDALYKSTDDMGRVNDSSGECKGVGRYSEEYGNFFAQGYTVKCNIQYIKVYDEESKGTC